MRHTDGKNIFDSSVYGTDQLLRFIGNRSMSMITC
jgi:hypothetical protein